MWLEIVKLIGAPLIAGFIAAYFSSHFAARFSFDRFRKEQWWQAKRDAYESLIRMLSDIVFTRWREIAKLETGGQIFPPEAPERKKDLTWSLQEISSAGAYIVSE